MEISLRSWREGGSWVHHRGQRVFLREGGRGEPLILIHGFPTSSADWRPLWSQLAEHYRLLAPDMMGFGFSDKPGEYGYSIADQASIIENILARRGVERVHVLAHDYGDTVAQELLARLIERRGKRRIGTEIASVCFLNGGLFPEAHRALVVQRLGAGPLGPLLRHVMSRYTFGKQFSAVFGPNSQPDSQTLDDAWSVVTEGGGLRVQHALLGYMEERLHHRARWVGALRGGSVPLRLINGGADPVSGAHAARRYEQVVPDADVVVLDDIGHYPHWEAPFAVLQRYLEFRARVEQESVRGLR